MTLTNVRLPKSHQVSKLRRRIRTAVEAGKTKKARWLVEEFLRAHAAKRLAVRLASRKLKKHLRPGASERDAIARTLDPWKGSEEPVFVDRQVKEHKPDDYRLVMNFGIEHRALQQLVVLALSKVHPLHPNQYALRGNLEAVKAAVKAMSLGPMWAIEVDIKDCYPSVNGEKLAALLPLPPKVCQKVLMCEHLNLKGGPSLVYAFGCEDDDEWYPELLADELAQARRGIPQGSAASPLIAEALLAPAIYLIPQIGVVVAYADNVLLLAKSKNDVVSMSNSLRCALKAHPAGPFEPKLKSFAPGDPVDFLGHRLTVAKGAVRIDPSPKNMAKFEARMKSKLARLKAAKLSSMERASRARKLKADVRSWCDGAFNLCTDIKSVRDAWLDKVTKIEAGNSGEGGQP